jgi:hypothetical protein
MNTLIHKEEWTMRRIFILLGLVVTVIVFVLPARANQLIAITDPFHAHELAGVIVDRTGALVPGVMIEDCVQTFGQQWTSIHEKKTVLDEPMLLDCHSEPKHVLASTTTDSKGHFKFPLSKTGTTHYLHLSCSGFDPMQITVKLRWFAKRNLKIMISIAT